MAGILIGYARVSTDQQDVTAQREALLEMGVEEKRIYVDHGLTGTNRDRPGLVAALAACREGDTLVVTKLDRLARSLPDARDIVSELTANEVKLSLNGSIHDPTDPVGRLLFNVLAMVAEFESDLIRARTREGMRVAKAKGRMRGKQPKLTRTQEEHLMSLHKKGEHTTSELARIFGVARSTVYRAIEREKERALSTAAAHEPVSKKLSADELTAQDKSTDKKSRPNSVKAGNKKRAVRLFPSQLQRISDDRLKAAGADEIARLAANHPWSCARHGLAAGILREEKPDAYKRLLADIEAQTKTADDLDGISPFSGILQDIDIDVLHRAVIAADSSNPSRSLNAADALARRDPYLVAQTLDAWTGIPAIYNILLGHMTAEEIQTAREKALERRRKSKEEAKRLIAGEPLDD